MANETKSRFSPFWALVIGLIIILGVMVLFRDVIFGSGGSPEPAQTPSTEWTTAPEGGVDVNLPETPIRAVEPEEATQSDGQNQADTGSAETN